MLDRFLYSIGIWHLAFGVVARGSCGFLSGDGNSFDEG